MPSYKLTYFNGKGRAECARMLFAAAGVEYEDHRIEFTEWPKLKPNTPLQSLPFLEVDGKTVVTSQTINRYLAREFNLYGKNNEENTDVDMVLEVVLDILTPFFEANFEKDEAKKVEKFKKLDEETAPKMFGHLEKKLAANDFFVGKSISLADIWFFVVMEFYTGKNKAGLDKFPKLKALNDRVAAQEKIAAWIKKRPETPF